MPKSKIDSVNDTTKRTEKLVRETKSAVERTDSVDDSVPIVSRLDELIELMKLTNEQTKEQTNQIHTDAQNQLQEDFESASDAKQEGKAEADADDARMAQLSNFIGNKFSSLGAVIKSTGAGDIFSNFLKSGLMIGVGAFLASDWFEDFRKLVSEGGIVFAIKEKMAEMIPELLSSFNSILPASDDIVGGILGKGFGKLLLSGILTALNPISGVTKLLGGSLSKSAAAFLSIKDKFTKPVKTAATTTPKTAVNAAVNAADGKGGFFKNSKIMKFLAGKAARSVPVAGAALGAAIDYSRADGTDTKKAIVSGISGFVNAIPIPILNTLLSEVAFQATNRLIPDDLGSVKIPEIELPSISMPEMPEISMPESLSSVFDNITGMKPNQEQPTQIPSVELSSTSPTEMAEVMRRSVTEPLVSMLGNLGGAASVDSSTTQFNYTTIKHRTPTEDGILHEVAAQ